MATDTNGVKHVWVRVREGGGEREREMSGNENKWVLVHAYLVQ